MLILILKLYVVVVGDGGGGFGIIVVGDKVKQLIYFYPLGGTSASFLCCPRTKKQ